MATTRHLLTATLICGGLLGLTQAINFGQWTAFEPSTAAPTRMRSRPCIAPNFLMCQDLAANFFAESYENCPALCQGFDPATRVIFPCSGVCDSSTRKHEIYCAAQPACKYTQYWYCQNLGSCVGTWTTWSETQCSQFCGGGTQVRSRECQDSLGALSEACTGGKGITAQNSSQACNTQSCPSYSDWSAFGSCTHSCGGGTQQRTRTCFDANGVHPTGIGCGTNDLITESQSQLCNVQDCPAFGPWSNTTCTVLCGGGTVTSSRVCFYLGAPSALCPGASALGTQSVDLPCNTGMCGQWTIWLNTTCTLSCGGGELTRTRLCLLSGLSSTTCEGANGQASQSETVACSTNECPMLTSWSILGPCSAPCEGGVQNYTRECMLSGAPASGCVGATFKQEPCNTQVCSCTPWVDQTLCSEACDGGVKTRRQNCTGSGVIDEVVDCNTQACEYGSWLDAGSCDVACGGGQKLQRRNCSTVGCTKFETRFMVCNTQVCTCTDWFGDGNCTLMCGNGTTSETRMCNTPSGPQTETRHDRCNTQDCSCVSFVFVSDCTEACDGGTRVQEWSCVNQTEVFLQNVTVACNTGVCEYGAWLDSTVCNATCGGGKKAQSRNCTTPGCSQIQTQLVDCGTQDCGCGNWTDVDSCSLTCGGGSKTQELFCGINGTNSRTVPCNEQTCPSCPGPWVDNTTCTEPCGGGTLVQTRICLDSNNQTIAENRTEPCNTEPCVAVGGGQLTWLIILASIVGAAILAALLYFCCFLCACCGAGAASERRVTAVAAFVINSIQVGSLGMIQWRGKTTLRTEKGAAGCSSCCGGTDDIADGNNVPMVRIFGQKSNEAAAEEGTSGNQSNNMGLDSLRDDAEMDATLHDLTQWASQMMDDSQNIAQTDVYELDNKTNNNSFQVAEDQPTYAWVHSRSFSGGQRPLSTFQSLARRFSSRAAPVDENSYAEMNVRSHQSMLQPSQPSTIQMLNHVNNLRKTGLPKSSNIFGQDSIIATLVHIQQHCDDTCQSRFSDLFALVNDSDDEVLLRDLRVSRKRTKSSSQHKIASQSRSRTSQSNKRDSEESNSASSSDDEDFKRKRKRRIRQNESSDSD